MAEKDDKTCDECMALDGLVFLLRDVPDKPHYNCRCTLKPVNNSKSRKTDSDRLQGTKDRSSNSSLNSFTKVSKDDTIVSENRGMSNGLRSAPTNLTDEQIATVKDAISLIGADPNAFDFNGGRRTSYDDMTDKISVKGDVFPDESSTTARDTMSVAAALAHEYYGHRANRGTSLEPGDWRDEVRASMTAAVRAPGLSDTDRQLLMQDAVDRMKESGVNYRITTQMRRILYGY